MTPDRWIVVRNWDRFQHPDVLRSSRPTWVKVYTDLLYDNDFLSLSTRRRGILFGLWLLYASSHGQVAVNTRRLSGLLHGRVTVADLKSLNEAGFIDFVASKPQAQRKQTASPEKRREEKSTTESSSTSIDDRNGLPFNNLEPALEIAVLEILREVTDKDEGSERVIRSYARRLPLGAVAKVAESVRGRDRHARYAVGALKDELRERGKL